MPERHILRFRYARKRPVARQTTLIPPAFGAFAKAITW